LLGHIKDLRRATNNGELEAIVPLDIYGKRNMGLGKKDS